MHEVLESYDSAKDLARNGRRSHEDSHLVLPGCLLSPCVLCSKEVPVKPAAVGQKARRVHQRNDRTRPRVRSSEPMDRLGSRSLTVGRCGSAQPRCWWGRPSNHKVSPPGKCLEQRHAADQVNVESAGDSASAFGSPRLVRQHGHALNGNPKNLEANAFSP